MNTTTSRAPRRRIEHRRPAARHAIDPTIPVEPIIRFDDEPAFVGSHLQAQLVQRQWRWW